MITYTLSPVHTDAYYIERAFELKALKSDFISIKDPTGLLTPARARTLFPAIVEAAGTIPMQLHSHCQSGLAPEVYQIAIATGFREGKPRGRVAQYDPALYEHQVPGGMISNLRAQLQAMRMETRLPAILEEAAQVRRDLGYPILVSPFAQYIITQAVLNVVQGERYKTIPDEVRKYAMGYYGRLAAEPSGAFMERANIRPQDMVTARPAEHVVPWLPQLRAKLGARTSDEDVLLAAFYNEALLAPLKKPEPVYQFRTSPLYELIRHIGTRSDIRHARIRFAGTEMSLSV